MMITTAITYAVIVTIAGELATRKLNGGHRDWPGQYDPIGHRDGSDSAPGTRNMQERVLLVIPGRVRLSHCDERPVQVTAAPGPGPPAAEVTGTVTGTGPELET